MLFLKAMLDNIALYDFYLLFYSVSLLQMLHVGPIIGSLKVSSKNIG